MKNLKIVLFIGAVFFSSIIMAQRGIGTVTPNKDAILDLTSSNKGFLLPRLALVSTSSASPLSTHIAGMVVYNTATSSNVAPGYYVNDGTQWKPILSESTPSDHTTNKSVFVGSGAGINEDALDRKNVFVGFNSGNSNTTGGQNVALGFETLKNNTTGVNLVSIGYHSLLNNIGGGNNTALGVFSLYNNTTGSNNLGVGNNTLFSNTSANFNIAIGHYSLAKATTGGNNTALGFNTLNNLDVGEDNIVIGNGSGDNITSENNNIIIGNNIQLPTPNYNNYLNIAGLISGSGITNDGTFSSDSKIGIGTSNAHSQAILELYSLNKGFLLPRLNLTNKSSFAPLQVHVEGMLVYNTATAGDVTPGLYVNSGTEWVSLGSDFTVPTHTQNESVFLGDNAGVNEQGIDRKNVFIGVSSGKENTTGANNVAVGFESLIENIEGASNTSIGYLSMKTNASGNFNTSLGAFSLENNISGSDNTAIGFGALSSNKSSDNIGIGTSAMSNISQASSQKNTAIGSKVLPVLTDGANNIVIGYKGGKNLTTGSNNIIIGNELNISSTTASDRLNIGGLIFASGGFGYEDNIGTGNVGIGINTPTERLHVDGNILASALITPDYVFQKFYTKESSLKPSYKMMNLKEIENFTRKNHHLPGVPSAKEVKEKGGILLNRAAEINLEKIEELFLHIINQQKIIDKQTEENMKLNLRLLAIEKSLKKILNK